jgi:hypothetical protein
MADLDSPEAQLLEFGLTFEQALMVLEWHERRAKEDFAHEFGERIAVVLRGILKPGNARLRALALAMAAGCNVIADARTMREAAAKEGCSVEYISRLAADWAAELGLPDGANRRGRQSLVGYTSPPTTPR